MIKLFYLLGIFQNNKMKGEVSTGQKKSAA